MCDIEKDLLEFNKSKTCKGGLSTVCRTCHSDLCKQWRINNKEQAAQYKRKYNYNLTEKQYQQLLTDHDNICAICLKDYDKTLHIDHDHGTMVIRGLLCSNCNTGLGLFKDDPILLSRASIYLESTS
jgi:hypothetical protein